MHTNECPPKVTKKIETVYDPKTDQNVQTVTWPRSASGIDTKEVIMHVLSKHQATVVDSNDEGYDPGRVQSPNHADVMSLRASSHRAAYRRRCRGTLLTPRRSNSPRTRLLTAAIVRCACPKRKWHQSSRMVSSRR